MILKKLLTLPNDPSLLQNASHSPISIFSFSVVGSHSLPACSPNQQLHPSQMVQKQLEQQLQEQQQLPPNPVFDQQIADLPLVIAHEENGQAAALNGVPVFNSPRHHNVFRDGNDSFCGVFFSMTAHNKVAIT